MGKALGNIIIGNGTDSAPVEIDLKTFLTTRCLVQASSGGGKSRTLRRLAEQLFDKVQTFIIDREGEFGTLRERFGYVQAGKNGETPTDPRTAEMLCYTLLENGASAIFDLYDLKEPDRHTWAKNFLDALMNAPKTLWHPVVVMVDEAHRLCPERGMGESEAYSSMIDLATDGRKRGFCAVYATQRLGKLSKNASAELLNRFIGRTIEDLDVDRAVDLMSVRRADRAEFELGLKQMKPGHFWAFGQAVATDRKLLHVGPVLTTHPEPGTPAAAMIPPTPESIKHLLPQLADIPVHAENKARTEEELRQEIANLKGRLTVAERKLTEKTVTVTVEKAVEKVVEIPAVDAKTIKAVHQVVWNIERAAGRFDKLLEMKAEIDNWCGKLSKDLNDAVEAQENARRTPVIADEGRIARMPAPDASDDDQPEGELQSDGEPLSRPQIAMLRALREFNAIDIDHVSRPQLGRGHVVLEVRGEVARKIEPRERLGVVVIHSVAPAHIGCHPAARQKSHTPDSHVRLGG